MASLIQITNAHKRLGDQLLLDGADVTLTDFAKVGFIGRNGAGKSTLLRIILGEEELDRGEVARHPALRLGYLRQHDPFLPGESALDFLMRDSGQPDWKCGEVAGEFELKGDYLYGPVAALSGGWQTRAKLAALLLHEPNLLLLDEPTNFLDLRTQLLLEQFLRRHRGACLVVSHDRAFLNNTCTHTLDLARGKLTSFPGTVEAYLEFARMKRETEERANAATQAKRKQLEDFIARNKARAATATLAKSKEKMLERLELTEIAADMPQVRIRAPRIDPRKGAALRCRDLAIGYADRRVCEGVELEIDHGSRMAVVGDNGQGKTTFLRTLVGSLPPLAGETKWGHGCSVGVYAQHVYTTLPETQTVWDYLRGCAARGVKDQEVLDVAGSFLFRGPHTRKNIGVLSGGERARLCLAGLMLSQHNVLILDEPGNHLDVDTVDALVDALLDYAGTLIFTSHDRHFTQRVATSIVEVRDGRVVDTRSQYAAYVEKVNAEIAAGERESAARLSAAPEAVRTASRPAVRTEKEVRKELKAVERLIAQLDGQKKAAGGAAADEIVMQLLEAEERWEALSAELGEEAW